MTEAVAERQGELVVLDRTGDSKMVWDRHRPDEVEAARAHFDSMRSKGYAGYRVTRGGDKGEVLSRFDPEAEKIIMAPPMQGG